MGMPTQANGFSGRNTMDDKGSYNPEAAKAAQRIAQEQQIHTADQLDLKRQQMKIDQATAARTKDLAAGRARGAELFADGSLGRVAEGYTPEEQNAMRDSNLGTINSAGKANLRALRIQQAANGIRGTQAVAQQGRMQNDQQQQVVGSERDLFLKNIDDRRTGAKYNIDQANREKQSQLVTELGYGSLGSADRGAVMQQLVGEKQAQAAANSGGGGKK